MNNSTHGEYIYLYLTIYLSTLLSIYQSIDVTGMSNEWCAYYKLVCSFVLIYGWTSVLSLLCLSKSLSPCHDVVLYLRYSSDAGVYVIILICIMHTVCMWMYVDVGGRTILIVVRSFLRLSSTLPPKIRRRNTSRGECGWERMIPVMIFILIIIIIGYFLNLGIPYEHRTYWNIHKCILESSFSYNDVTPPFCTVCISYVQDTLLQRAM